MGDGYYLYPDVAGLALSGGRSGSLCPQDRGVVNEADAGARDRSGRLVHGRAPTQSSATRSRSFRPGDTVWQR